MKTHQHFFSTISIAGILAFTLISPPDNARANVYATDIKINGGLTTATGAVGAPVTISYRLNQRATAGVTINVLNGTNVVSSMSPSTGTNMGLNTVSWTPSSNGTYSVSVTAGATGFPVWTQISVDTNSGMPAFYPLGIAVDKNTNSPYYGRVVMGCAVSGTAATATVPLAAEKVGFYKMNADGTQADEGWYGNASYTNDDGKDTPVAGQMPNSGGYDPMIIRVSDDDRIYWVDNSDLGAIVACDMQATTNQIVINEAGYQLNDDYADLIYGFQEFDVTQTTTTNAAVWLCDNDYPNWGVMMYHLTNGTVNSNDVYGTQAITTGGDLYLVSSGGCMVDTNLDIFVGQSRAGENPFYDAMVFTNFNGGVLPPLDTDNSTFYNYSLGTAIGQVAWGYGIGVDQTGTTSPTGDPTFESVRDQVINSRDNPTMVAIPMVKGTDNSGGGIRVLNATNGFLITVTNGVTVQTLTNIDWAQDYSCAAWDGVGNLYAASTSRNLWRVWTPPGTNQSTTVAFASLVVGSSAPYISHISLSNSIVTISFTGATTNASSDFSLQSSPLVQGPYTTVAGAVISGSAGSFTASTSTNGATEFYRINR